MSLSALKLSSRSRPLRAWQMTADEQRRERVIQGLAIQRCIAEADRLEKPLNLKRTVRQTDEAGVAVERTVQRRPRRWFWRTPEGAYLMQVLYDGQPVPLEKDKTTVECDDLSALLAAIDVLEEAAKAGELDSGLAKIANASRRMKKKAA